MASIITTAGEQFIPAAVSGSAPLTNYRIADQIIFANVAGLDHTATPSPDEQIPATVVHTEDISSFSSTNDNNAIFTALLDSSTGDFEFNWLGLYNSEYDVLIQVAYEPPQQKYATDGSEIGNVLAKGMVLKIENAAASFDMTQPAQSWQVDFTGRQKAAEDIQRDSMRKIYGTGTYQTIAGQVIKHSTVTGQGKLQTVESVYRVQSGAAIIDGLVIDIPETDTDIDTEALQSEYPFYVYASMAQEVSVGGVENTIEIVTSQQELTPYSDQYGQEYVPVLLALLTDENTIIDAREHITNKLKLTSSATEQYTGQTRYATTEEHEQREEKQAAATPGGVDELISKMFAGQVSHFPGTVAPSGWLQAKGQSISRSDYPYLWAFAQESGNLSATEGSKTDGQFGPGDGSETFTLPDLRGVHIRNWDDSKGTDSGRAIGSDQADQNKSHSHEATTANAGSHNHSASTNTTGSHSHSASSATAGGHSHTYGVLRRDGGTSNILTGSKTLAGGMDQPRTDTTNTTNSTGSHSHAISVGSAGNHSHSVTVNSAGSHSHTVTVNADGGTETRVKNIALMACIKY